MQDSRHVAGHTFRSAFRAILCMIGVSVIPLASAQSFWEYSAQGSFFGPQGNILNTISGSLLIDGTVRAWHSPNLPSVFPSNQQHAFLVSSFDLDIGNLDFFGGGPFSNPGNTNALYMGIVDPVPGTFAFSSVEWFLTGSGDFTSWFGDSQLFNSDGTRASVQDIFQAPPALVRTSGGAICSGALCGHVQMDFTRVAPIPEPEIYAMIGIGFGLMTWVARRKKLKESAPA
jgi:hypothetical protein